MGSRSEQYKLALVSSIEIVLMRRGNVEYNMVVAKLGARYGCNISDCYEHPEYLRTVLAEVYHEKYLSIIHEIKSYLGDLAEEPEMVDFFNKVQH